VCVYTSYLYIYIYIYIYIYNVCMCFCLYLFLLVIALFFPFFSFFCITYVGQRMTNFLQISAPGQKSRTQICLWWIYVVTTNNINPLPFIIFMSNKSQDTHTYWEYSSEMKWSGIIVLQFFTKYCIPEKHI